MKWMDKQLGTAVLEEGSLISLIKGIIGRILQYFAMYIPMTPLMRVKLQRLRGVKIGKNVFVGREVLIDPVYPDLVKIDDHVSLAGRNMIIAHSDPTTPLRKANLTKA